MNKIILLALVFISTSYAQEITIDFETDNYAKKSSQFRCDGRQHCSQMSSCAEAKFFIDNCPNTKMDGDNDGKPCERECGH